MDLPPKKSPYTGIFFLLPWILPMVRTNDTMVFQEIIQLAKIEDLG